MSEQSENPNATKLEDETLPDTAANKTIERVVEKPPRNPQRQ